MTTVRRRTETAKIAPARALPVSRRSLRPLLFTA